MNGRILVVDDDADTADAFARLIGILGCEAKAVYNGHVAITEAVRFGPDMVLIDLGMPELDGYATAQAIRRQPGCRHAILVAVSGWVGKEHQRQATASGFD